jgi:prepilin-type N-terminal cleavage/methylation domain-containing protein
MKNKKAFTLGEYLIVIAIIGVLSVLIVPGLKEGSRNKAYVTQAQKAYATLSESSRMIGDTEGSLRFVLNNCMRGNATNAPKCLGNLYQKYLNTISVNQSSLNAYSFNNFDGSPASTEVDSFKKSTSSVFATVDGMLYSIPLGYLFKNGNLYSIIVDTNGFASPNKIGYDVILFNVTTDGLTPAGINGECLAGNIDFNCTYRIINEGKISW